MSDIKTRADSIRRYLTGAGSDGGAQTDPDLSIGNFRGSTQVTSRNIAVTSPITGIAVDFASSDNGEGAGTLTVTGADTLTWKAPNEASTGPVVTILDGETKLLEAGSGKLEKFVIITRSTASALSGTATVTLTAKFNNVYDDKTSAESVAGDIDFRCIAIKNDSANQILNTKAYIGKLSTVEAISDTAQLPASGAGTIQTVTDLSTWPDQGFVAIMNGAALREVAYYSSRTSTVLTVPSTGRAMLGSSAAAGDAADDIIAVPGISIAIDAPTSQPSGNFESPVDESTAPGGGITFSNVYINADGLSIGTLNTGEIFGIWIRRENPAAAVSDGDVKQNFVIDYDAA